MQGHDPNERRDDTAHDAGHIVREMLHRGAVSATALVDRLVQHALAAGASDVHILPGKEYTSIWFRIDGQLAEQYRLPLAAHAELIARLKILSGIRTDEQYLPHDGRFSFEAGTAIDVRVTTAPTHHGEKSVLRLLSQANAMADLQTLGISHEHQEMLEAAMERSQGMVLVTGPTGSGKTTTLYSLLAICGIRNRSVVTIEDPVERALDGISQIPVNPLRGFTFAHALRSVLRQDPDVIMVGEIRDTETAQLACTAALTGHLVFSSLHTGDTATSLVRLRNLGVEPYMITAGVSLVVAQRLIRRVCAACSVPSPLDVVQQDALRIVCERYGILLPDRFEPARGIGCEHCNASGYRGRIGAYELFVAHDAAYVPEPLMHDALQKVAAGITSFDEAMRLTRTGL